STRRTSRPSARGTRLARPVRRSCPLTAPAKPAPPLFSRFAAGQADGHALARLHRAYAGCEPRRAYAHLDEVPSAALKTRRARVPVIVSFTAIRSHAPASTSSNVR